MDEVSLQQRINSIPLLKYRYLVSSFYDYVPTLDIDTFAVINNQPSNMQCEHWMFFAKFRPEMYFAGSLGREKYQFLEQNYKQTMPAQLQSYPCLWFLHFLCTFLSLNLLSGKNYLSSRFLLYSFSVVNKCNFSTISMYMCTLHEVIFSNLQSRLYIS